MIRRVFIILLSLAAFQAQGAAIQAQEVGPGGANPPEATSQVIVHPSSWRWDECRFQGLFHVKWAQAEEELTARCAVRHWGVPGGFAKLDDVISCESGWNRFAVSASGSYVGLAQHVARSWYARFRAFAPPLWQLRSAWWNSRTHLIVTVRMVHAGGWAPWACA